MGRIQNSNPGNVITNYGFRIFAARSDAEYDAQKNDLDKKIREMEEQQRKIAEMMESLTSRETRQQPLEPNPFQQKSRVKNSSSGMDFQVSSAPLKVMIFVDGTWLYYSLHEAQSPIHLRYGSGWQYKYKFDWNSLPRVICKSLQEQDKNLGWSTMAQDTKRSGRPIEVVRVMVYTSYKTDTPKHSFRYQMFQEMMNAKYDVHMMETVGRVEKCIDIQLAVDMLHYATVPDAYDIAVLLSGDKDFMPAMIRTRQKGRRVGLASTRTACNRVLRENSNIKDYDVVFLDDYLDELLIPMKKDEAFLGNPSLSRFTLLKIISDFVRASRLEAGVNSRDIGRYMKSLTLGSRNLLDEVKEIYGGLYQFLVVSEIFKVEPWERKEFLVSVESNADFVMQQELKDTRFTREESQFFEDYSVDSLEENRDDFYEYSFPAQGDSTSQPNSRPAPIRESVVISDPKEDNIEDLSSQTVAQLKELCRERGLPISGRKADLVKRIEADKESKKPQKRPTEEYLEALILEFLQAKGGQASSRDVGRYLATNKASPGRLVESGGVRTAALTELKEVHGSLQRFIIQSDAFIAKGIKGNAEFTVYSSK
ncbi:unnamed protein product [Cylindrotheca closterium]|uniref:SAP domain-containing protein n=1 Tax=Cylindrotheca closterium TaxID=2856 RepID=A0AAD2JNS9_9STRA|nr:unnamed protein product [Cylindrotheca closterium]